MNMTECIIDQKIKEVNQDNIPTCSCYFIDTNIFIAHPNILDSIDMSSRIVISSIVIDELDRQTRQSKDPELKRDAAKALSSIYAHENDKRIIWEKGCSCILDGWSPDSADNRIISEAIKVKKQNNLPEIAILTKDNALALKVEFHKNEGIRCISL